MSLKIDSDQAKDRINDFIGQVEGLLELSYGEGKEEKKEMETKLNHFAETAFSDSKKKKNKLYSSIGVVTAGEKSPQRKQQEYEESLKRKLRNLKAWKEQIELEEYSSEERDKINKLEEEIQEEKLESDRREKVATQKSHGAVIELLDLQRDRIKDMEDTNKEITEIKKGIEDIKELLEKLFGEQGGDMNE